MPFAKFSKLGLEVCVFGKKVKLEASRCDRLATYPTASTGDRLAAYPTGSTGDRLATYPTVQPLFDSTFVLVQSNLLGECQTYFAGAVGGHGKCSQASVVDRFIG